MCTPEERDAAREEKKRLMKAVEDYVVARVKAAVEKLKPQHEPDDCPICVWGCRVERRTRDTCKVVHECSQDGRPKPCQKGLFKVK